MIPLSLAHWKYAIYKCEPCKMSIAWYLPRKLGNHIKKNNYILKTHLEILSLVKLIT